jgi:hypothetical protein
LINLRMWTTYIFLIIHVKPIICSMKVAHENN